MAEADHDRGPSTSPLPSDSDKENASAAATGSRSSASKRQQPTGPEQSEQANDDSDEGTRNMGRNVYNPFQSEDERLKLHQSYRTLLTDVKDNQHELLKTDDSRLRETVLESDKLFRGVRQTGTAMLDAELIQAAGELTRRRVKNLQLGGLASFDMSDFIDCVARKYQPHNDADGWHWNELGEEGYLCGKRAVTMDFLHGPLSVERKKRKVTATARFVQQTGATARVEEISKHGLSKTQNSTEDHVRTIAKVLMGLGKVDFYCFCINPESFSQTIENIFYVSFLIRDNRVLVEDIDGRLMISYIDPSNRESEDSDQDDEEDERAQMIATIDLNGWQTMKEAFDIREPLIPSRKAYVPATNGWYT